MRHWSGSAGRWPATSNPSASIAKQPASGRLYRFFAAADYHGSAGRWPATSNPSASIAKQPASGRLYRFFAAADYHGSAGRWPATSNPSASIAKQPASGRLYRFFFAALSVAAARSSALNAAASGIAPSWMSIARRVLPSRLALNSPFGSASAAPLAKVSFTACL